MIFALLAAYVAFSAFISYYTVRPYVFSAVQFFKKEFPKNEGLEKQDMVSVIIPTYNEASTIRRILEHVLSFDYPNYEVIVADDSTDETYEILKEYKDPRLKVVHREERKGWKAGAINNALNYLDPNSKYVVILDSDSVPPKDLLSRLVERIKEGYDAVQGVQMPVLNTEVSYLAKANSIIQSYYQLVEQPSKFYLGLPVTLTGSNFIIKAELLKLYKLNEDIGEDWELTLRLAKDGYKIAYAPDIAVKCEVPFSVRDSINQYVRWNEGMVRATSRRLNQIMRSEMPFISKVDLIMTGFTPFIAYAVIITAILGAYIYFNDPGLRVIVYFVTAFVFVSGAITMISSAYKAGISYLYAVFSEILYFIYIPFAIYATVRGLALRQGKFVRTNKLGYFISKG